MSAVLIPSTEFAPDLATGSVEAAGSSAGASRSGGNYDVPPQAIRVIEGFNFRIKNEAYWERVEGLCKKITANGYDRSHPLKVFVAKDDAGSFYGLVSGHHRLDAVLMAISKGYAIEKIPCVVAPKGTSMEDLTFDLINTNSAEPPSPYEMAIVIKRLIGQGVSSEEILRRTGFKNQRYIDDLLSLLAAPKEVREMVMSGRVSSTLAITELKEGKPSEVVERLKAAVDTAQAAGKDRVTAKHVTKPKKARKPPKELKPIIVTQAAAMVWVEESGFAAGGEADERFLRLVSRVAKEVFDRGGFVEIDSEEL